MSIFQLAWERFRQNAKILGDIQGHIAAGVFYFTIMIPFGLIARASSDPLKLKGSPGWTERHPVDNDLEAARRQG